MKLVSKVVKEVEVERGENGVSLSQDGNVVLMTDDQLAQFLDVYQSAKLAAIRKAGEKMKAALEDIKLGNDLYGADIETANSALAEWEAANK